MITFTVETTARDTFAVYERLSDGRRWNCRAVCATRAEAEESATRFTATEERIAAMPRQQIAPDTDYCWECGQPITQGDGIIGGLGMAHRSCVGA